jgi:hypothetical protein
MGLMSSVFGSGIWDSEYVAGMNVLLLCIVNYINYVLWEKEMFRMQEKTL